MERTKKKREIVISNIEKQVTVQDDHPLLDIVKLKRE